MTLLPRVSRPSVYTKVWAGLSASAGLPVASSGMASSSDACFCEPSSGHIAWQGQSCKSQMSISKRLGCLPEIVHVQLQCATCIIAYHQGCKMALLRLKR